MTHLQTARHPMPESRRQHIHGPLQSDTARQFAWLFKANEGYLIAGSVGVMIFIFIVAGFWIGSA